MRQILFVCEGNIHRSPTAEKLYANTPGLKTRSAGLSSCARVQVTEDLLAWADEIFVMEGRLLRQLLTRFPGLLEGKRPVNLKIPDDYQFLQPALQEILSLRLHPYLGAPGPT